MNFLNWPPHWYRGLSRGKAAGAGIKRLTCLQTIFGGLQAHETELYLTALAEDVFASGAVMPHQEATGGAGTEGGTAHHIVYVFKGDCGAVLQSFQGLVDAAVIVTAVRA